MAYDGGTKVLVSIKFAPDVQHHNTRPDQLENEARATKRGLRAEHDPDAISAVRMAGYAEKLSVTCLVTA